MTSQGFLDWLERWAASQPGVVAIRDRRQRTVTYAELLRVVKGVSAALRQAGLRRGDRIATVLPDGLVAAASLLGVAAAAIAVPLDPASTEHELRRGLTDLRARLVLVEGGNPGHAAAVAGELGIPVALCQDDLGLSVRPVAGPAQDRPVRADDVALILRTSGSTGKAKTVPLSHGNLAASAGNVAMSLGLTPEDDCLNLMPLFHIHGLVAGLLAPLFSGGSATCAGRFDPAAAVSWLTGGVTWYTGVPTLHQAVLRAFAGSDVTPARLRFIRSCSASLAPSLLRDLEERFGVPVLEAYGMTEASHQIASNPPPPLARKPGSVGRPTGTRIRVAGSDGQSLPAGEPGEVQVSGPGLTSGYEDQQANELAFADGWLRTGDQGYFDDDGYLFLTGRLKELINRGGEKIAPREVEEAVLEHPSVSGVAAFAVPHEMLGQEVGVAVVADNGCSVDPAEIQRFARDRLSHFKVPRYVRVVAALPRGPTGKTLRIGLADELGIGVPDLVIGRAPFQPAATDLERFIAGVFGEVTGLDPIGADDDFLLIGGDSIGAATVAGLIRARCGVELAVPEVLELATPRRLEASILARKLHGQDDAAIGRLLQEIAHGD